VFVLLQQMAVIGSLTNKKCIGKTHRVCIIINNVVSMAIMSFVLVESDTVVHEELDDEIVHSSLAFFHRIGVLPVCFGI